MGATEAFREEVLDLILNNVAITTPQITHMSLHNADPGETGANELTGGSYAREAISFNTPASGQADNSATVTFSNLPTDTVTHVGLWSALSGGTFVWGGAMSTSKSVEPGDTIEFSSGTVVVPTAGS